MAASDELSSSLELINVIMPFPDYIDKCCHKLQDVLKTLIEQEYQMVLNIATVFFRIETWLRLEDAMNTLTSLHMLIGRNLTIRPAESDRLDLICYFHHDIQQQLEQVKVTYK